MSTISPEARRELVTAVAERYQHSTSAEKGWILDEFVALTGYHRKHAIRLLNGSSVTPGVRRGRRCVYDDAVTEGRIVLWEASDRMCGKRLKALLPIVVPALERHGHLSLDPRVRERPLAVSAATVDRRLAPARAVTAGQRRPRRSRRDGVRGSVPVRTFGDWKDPAPGFVEADLVAHCGRTMAGSFVSTLVFTDIASGWPECVPLLVREAQLAVLPLERLHPQTLVRRRTAPAVTFHRPHPVPQRLRRAADLLRDRPNGRPLRVMLALQLEHHPNRPLPYLR